MGLFQKKKLRNYYQFIERINLDDPASWENKNLNTMTGQELISSYGLEAQTTDFIGHAVALYTDDSYLARPAFELAQKSQLY